MSRSTTSKKDERIDLRVSKAWKALLVRAATLRQQSVSQFIAEAAFERANTLVREEEILKLSQRDAEQFLDALEQAKPTEVLLNDARAYREAIANGRIESR